MAHDSFPRHAARTRNFRLGAPRQVLVSDDDQRIIFVRSTSGTAAVNRLVVVDLDGDTLTERTVADPLSLLGGGDEHLPAAERARRERMRESTSGVTSFSCDHAATIAVFALSGRLFVAELTPGSAVPRELSSLSPAVDPRMSPDGRHVSYVHDRALRIVSVDGDDDRLLVGPDSEDVTWGLADFIAAEELDRHRGQWWSPDSRTLIAERYDESLVATWWISDPATPGSEPVAHRYPAAGTANADVTLHLIDLDGARTAIEWDRVSFPYVTAVSWSSTSNPLITVMSRDQRHCLTLEVDPADGSCSQVLEQEDAAWVDVVPGLPRRLHDGRLLHAVDDRATDTRRLAADGEFLTPAGAQLMGVSSGGPESVVATIAVTPTTRSPWLIAPDGHIRELADGDVIASAAVGTEVSVVARTAMDSVSTTYTVLRGERTLGELVSFADSPEVTPRVEVLRAGPREVVTAVLFPSRHVRGSGRLPVVMAPYGGPHHSEVLASGLAFAQDQWIADQGFVVIIADGRGTPGRGPAWEREVSGNFVDPVLEDQIDALAAVAAAYPDDVDTSRVGIIGWSFGGWLAGLAVLERPDVFHAAVAGAPVTDWRLYDTAYTERYLGHPDAEPAAYEHQSLVARADRLRNPLMLVHGLSDDNVVIAHTLALSGALLAAGCPHTVLPLTGITHMATQEDVAENLLLLQIDFLRRALAEH